ncbi:MAG TPA: hypothetical protein VGQ38_06505 [Gaiellaceae bacterium]|nr:hypothetical protein [Gaiellaceae bacterium]
MSLAVVSAVVGLVAAVFGLPSTVATALGRSAESKEAKLDLQAKRTQVAAQAPHLTVSYLVIATNVNVGSTFGGKPRKHLSAQATTVLSLPAVQNEVLDDEYRTAPKACHGGARPDEFITALVVRNRGQRDADHVALRLDRLVLKSVVPIHEATVGGDDYIAKLRGSARGSQSATIRIGGEPLGPGEGVRIPLWASVSRVNQYSRWCVLSHVALLPLSLQFRDPLLGSTKTLGVRRMASPVVLASGLVGRG